MRQYSTDFREQALKLSDEIGLQKTFKQLGVNYETLSGWRKIRKRKSGKKLAPKTSSMTDQEKQLLKENQELKEANEILKDALCFFARDRKK
jgi:transposase